MNCLIVSHVARDCEKCSARIRPGIVASVRTVDGHAIRCPNYLKARDPLLTAAWEMIRDFGSLSALEQHIRPPQFPLPGE